MSEWQFPKAFDPHMNPSQIVLVGVGGTGGHIARLLARLLSHMQGIRLHTPRLILVDPDRVEAKNVGRQLFSPADVGYFKAEVVAKRLSLAFGLAIEWVNASFDAQQAKRNPYSTLLIDAVDNHHARQAIAQARSSVLISCGNHFDSAQVSLGNCSNRAELERYLAEVEKRQVKLGEKDSLRYLPTAYLLFPELLEAAPRSELADVSCSDLVLQQEQDVLINDAVALVAVRYVQQLLFRQPIHSFVTFISLSNQMSVKATPITVENIRAYLEKTA